MVLGRLTLGLIHEATTLRAGLIFAICTSLCMQIVFRLSWHLSVSMILSTGIGFCAGPTYPAGIVMLTSRLPKRMHLRAIATSAALGQIGGAVAPFVIGVIAQRAGITRLFDVVLGLSSCMLVVWLKLSNLDKPASVESPFSEPQ
jgi:fucose permease